MASAAAALTALSATTATKIAKAIKSLQDARDVRRQRIGTASSSITALDLDVRAQIDEVFLVLALLGEVLLPLSVFDNLYYPQTLDEVEACIVSSGHELMPTAFGGLDPELQYAITAGLSLCSIFTPMPVYRGFGAAVLGDWNWGCPDTEKLLKKLKARDSTLNGFLKRNLDPQPNRAVLLAFDQVIRMLQVKQMAFLSVKPVISGFAEQQPRYDPRSVRKQSRELDLRSDWTRRIEKFGHPAPTGMRTTNWAIPYTTYTSSFSCEFQTSRNAWETIMANQMDPGRLLHAFVCRGNLKLSETQLLILPPGSPAESLACWLEGLPGMPHKIVKWSDLDTAWFDLKCSKGMRKLLGQYPLPNKFVIQDADIPHHRPSLTRLPSSPFQGQTAPPPGYSQNGIVTITTTDAPDKPAAPPTIELATERDPVELAGTTSPTFIGQIHHATSTTALTAGKHLSAALVDGTFAPRSVSVLKRKEVPVTHRASLLFPPKPLASPPHTPVQSPGRSSALVAMSDLPPATTLSGINVQTPKLTHTSTVVPPYPSNQGLVTEQTALPAEQSQALGASAEPVELPTGEDDDDDDDYNGLANTMTLSPSKDARSVTPANPASAQLDVLSNPTEVAELPSESSSATYLELLNRVARGEISPQALSQMLQAGNIAQELDATSLHRE